MPGWCWTKKDVGGLLIRSVECTLAWCSKIQRSAKAMKLGITRLYVNLLTFSKKLFGEIKILVYDI